MPQIYTGTHVKSGINSNWFELGWKVHIRQFTVDVFVCLYPVCVPNSSKKHIIWIFEFCSLFFFICFVCRTFYLSYSSAQEFPSFLPSIPFSSACSNVSSWNVSRFQHSHNFSHLIFLCSRLVRKFWNSSIQASIHQLQYEHSYDFTRFYITSCFQRWFFYFWFSLRESSKNSNQCIQRKAVKL